MKNKTLIISALLIIFLMSACGAKTTAPTAAPAAPAVPVAAVSPTSATDLCSKEKLPDEVSKVNDLMREFDDYSRLASSTPQDKLVQIIPTMQEVRRRAEVQKVPDCLRDLKVLQINHMNTVIEILMVFMANAQSADVNQGIAQARDLHMKYDVEIARLLGLTLVAPPTGDAVAPIVPNVTVDPNATVPPASLTKPAGLSILNPGPNEVTLLSAPDATAGGVATLPAGSITPAFGRTADGLWFQVEVPGQPGQKAWVSTSAVQISGEPPIVSP
jgi:hypothetical protein